MVVGSIEMVDGNTSIILVILPAYAQVCLIPWMEEEDFVI